MYRDFFVMALRNIKGKGIRSWLTMMGIVIGIAAIVSLISLGEGLQEAINEQFSLLGSNLIYVQPSGAFAPGGSGMKITDREVDIVKDVRGIELAAGMVTKVAKVKFRDEVVYSYVSGIDTGDAQDILLDGTGISVVRGQKELREGDDDKVAVGYEFWSGNLFKRAVVVGDTIELDDRKFEVVGEISRIGNPSDDSNVYITLDAAKKLFDVDDYAVIMARVKDGYDVKKVAEKIEEDLRNDRGLKEGEEDFMVMTLEEIRDSVGVILDAVQAIVIGIAFISLLVGGIGIMNTMYTSVLERTREIGVMKAIGARNDIVLSMFLVESGIIGMVGGLVGCAIGAGLGKAVEYVATVQFDQTIIQAAVTPQLVLGALFFSFTVGVISGILPARQASRLNPVDALRYE